MSTEASPAQHMSSFEGHAAKLKTLREEHGTRAVILPLRPQWYTASSLPALMMRPGSMMTACGWPAVGMVLVIRREGKCHRARWPHAPCVPTPQATHLPDSSEAMLETQDRRVRFDCTRSEPLPTLWTLLAGAGKPTTPAAPVRGSSVASQRPERMSHRRTVPVHVK